jgi:hypothetical protein
MAQAFAFRRIPFQDDFARAPGDEIARARRYDGRSGAPMRADGAKVCTDRQHGGRSSS